MWGIRHFIALKAVHLVCSLRCSYSRVGEKRTQAWGTKVGVKSLMSTHHSEGEIHCLWAACHSDLSFASHNPVFFPPLGGWIEAEKKCGQVFKLEHVKFQRSSYLAVRIWKVIIFFDIQDFGSCHLLGRTIQYMKTCGVYGGPVQSCLIQSWKRSSWKKTAAQNSWVFWHKGKSWSGRV